MAKRLTETELWDKTWFMSLPCKLKCLVRYLFDKCDNVGIWEPNYVIATAYIGEPITQEDILSIDDGRQFELMDNGKIFVSDFCDFQYGELTPNCKPHQPVIKKLKKLGLYERVSKGYSKGIHTLEEKEKEKDIEKEKEKDQEKEAPAVPKKNREKPKLELENEQKEIRQKYSETVTNLTGMEKNEVWGGVKDFIQKHKPEFVEPYVDAWNIFALKYSLVDNPITITEDRKSKIKIRTREPSFDFFSILQVIAKSSFLKGDNDRGWKVDFDFILHSEKNYIKILEGKYK